MVAVEHAKAEYHLGMLTVKLPVSNSRPASTGSIARRSAWSCEDEASAMAIEREPDTGGIPSELAILPLQDAVLFPNTVMPLAVTKPHGIKLVEDALKAGVPVGVVALKDRDASPPSARRRLHRRHASRSSRR